jgi:hypothetical protein
VVFLNSPAVVRKHNLPELNCQLWNTWGLNGDTYKHNELEFAVTTAIWWWGELRKTEIDREASLQGVRMEHARQCRSQQRRWK